MTYKKKTVNEWLEEWLDVYVKPPVRTQNTYDCYRYVIVMMKKIQPGLFQMQLKDVDEITVQKLLNQSAEKYAKSTLKKMKIIFKSSYEIAIRNHKCKSNPALFVTIPNATEKEIRALTQEEEIRVIEAAKHDRLGHIAIFMLYTGLRTCEITNLKWSDYNFQKKEISIRKSKTKRGIRIVPVIQEANNIINSLPHYCEYIFTSTKKNPITKTVMRRLYNRLRKKTGIEIITNHVYRHSFATRMIENNADYKALSVILGHSDVEFTINTYTNAETKFLHEQVSLLENKSKRKVFTIKNYRSRA